MTEQAVLHAPALLRRGNIIRRADWEALGNLHALHADAEHIRGNASVEVAAACERGHVEGLAQGRVEGLAQVATELLRVQTETRALLRREQARIAELACAVVARIAPRLDGQALISALVAEAVGELQAEQFLYIYVHPDRIADAEIAVARLRSELPGLDQLSVFADPQLDKLGCMLVSEAGKLEAGFDEQLAALRVALCSADNNESAAP